MREPIRDKSRLEHIIDAIDTIMERASRQHTFDFLRGDGMHGRKLPVASDGFKLLIVNCAYIKKMPYLCSA